MNTLKTLGEGPGGRTLGTLASVDPSIGTRLGDSELLPSMGLELYNRFRRTYEGSDVAGRPQVMAQGPSMEPQQAAPEASRLHPYAQFILDINRYNPANVSPLQMIEDLARRTTGDFFFPMERLQKHRQQKRDFERELDRYLQPPQPVENR